MVLLTACGPQTSTSLGMSPETDSSIGRMDTRHRLCPRRKRVPTWWCRTSSLGTQSREELDIWTRTQLTPCGSILSRRVFQY